MPLFDLTQPLENGMPVYPGDPGPTIKNAPGIPAPWRVTELHLNTHLGTHIDAPAHYFPQGPTLDQYPLERLVLPGLVLNAGVGELAEQASISWEALAAPLAALPPGGAVVVQTGWERFWGTERYWQYPALSVAAARGLAQSGVSLIGLDTPSADPLQHTPPLIHEILLGQDILLVENLCGLAQLTPGVIYQLAFLPLRLPGLDGSPVRAVALI